MAERISDKTHVLIGEKYSGILAESLESSGLQPVFIPDNPHVDKRLSGHGDLSVFYPGGDKIFLAPHLKNSTFSEKLQKSGLKTVFLDMIQGEKYPDDAQMNICRLGSFFIHSPGVSHRALSKELISIGLTPISVRQGYIKCCVCPTGEGSLISSDPGIEKSCLEHGLEVLKISPGFISLEGFGYGFIGGSAFMPDEKTLAFTGRIDAHPDAVRILEHLEKHGIKPLFLTDRPIFDIGSFILI